MARLARHPGESLPTAMMTEAELEAAYRFFSNESVTFEALLEAHASSVVDRLKEDVVLAVHDTTNCRFGHADPREVGFLQTGKAGFLLHYALLVSSAQWKRPLGVVHAETIRRKRRTRHRKDGSGPQAAKWKGKESARWQRGIDAVEARLGGKGSAIHLADREGDQYELLSALVGSGRRFVIRACYDRRVDEPGLHIRELIDGQMPILSREVPLTRRLAKTAPEENRRHPPRNGRPAKLRISRATAALRAPYYAKGPASTAVNVVHVREVDAPRGQEPVDWILYTSEPIDTPEQVAAVVDYYRCRWVIEELNKALKSGCVVEDRELESYEGLRNLLAMSLPIAVELLALRSLARSDPERPATEMFSPSQLAALRHLSHRPLPQQPTIQDALWCIAGIGGHIKNNGQPGWEVLQRGMSEFLSFAAGWRAREASDL